MITGLNSAGVDVADLRVLPSAVSRHLLKVHGYDAGFHVGVSQSDPEMLHIRFFEQPGIQMTPDVGEGGRQALHPPRGPPRAVHGHRQRLVPGARARGLCAGPALDARRRRDSGPSLRIVIDYGHSASSFVLPLMLGELGIEAISAHGFTTEAASTTASLRESIGQAKRSSARSEPISERSSIAPASASLVDEKGREIAVEQNADPLSPPARSTRGVPDRSRFRSPFTSGSRSSPPRATSRSSALRRHRPS